VKTFINFAIREDVKVILWLGKKEKVVPEALESQGEDAKVRKVEN